MSYWLDKDVIKQRVKLLDDIIGILTSSIVRLRKGDGSNEEGSVDTEAFFEKTWRPAY